MSRYRQLGWDFRTLYVDPFSTQHWHKHNVSVPFIRGCDGVSALGTGKGKTLKVKLHSRCFGAHWANPLFFSFTPETLLKLNLNQIQTLTLKSLKKWGPVFSYYKNISSQGLNIRLGLTKIGILERMHTDTHTTCMSASLQSAPVRSGLVTSRVSVNCVSM